MLEDYEDNTLKVTTRTLSNQEVTLTTVGIGQSEEKGAVCFHFSKKGHCRRGRSCKFRHVNMQVGRGQTVRHKRQKVTSEQYRHPTPHRGKGAGKAQKTGACHNCGKEGHWARECRKPKVERSNVTSDWTMTTFDFVRAGNIQGLSYIPDRWLVDSASTFWWPTNAFPSSST